MPRETRLGLRDDAQWKVKTSKTKTKKCPIIISVSLEQKDCSFYLLHCTYLFLFLTVQLHAGFISRQFGRTFRLGSHPVSQCPVGYTGSMGTGADSAGPVTYLDIVNESANWCEGRRGAGPVP